MAAFLSYSKHQKIPVAKRGTGDAEFEKFISAYTKGVQHDPTGEADREDVLAARALQAEARELLARAAELQTEAHAHRNAIIRRNARMILAKAKEYAGAGNIPVSDLWQSAIIGVITGLSKYDPDHRTDNGTTKVTSYLFSWIKKFILEDLEDAASPATMQRNIARIWQKARKLISIVAAEYEMDEANVPMDILVERLLESDDRSVLEWKKKIAKDPTLDIAALAAGIIAAHSPAMALSHYNEDDETSTGYQLTDGHEAVSALEAAIAKSEALRMKGVFIPIRTIIHKINHQGMSASDIKRLIKIFEPQSRITIELLAEALTEDGGLAYHSQAFIDACLEMNISHPEAVGKVGTLLRTLEAARTKAQTPATIADLFSGPPQPDLFS